MITEDSRIVLIDFGCALRLSKNNSAIQTSKVMGTSEYLAPECWIGSYSTSSDVWALGILLCYLLSITPPKIGENINFDGQRIISNDCKDFIKELLRENPEERPSAKNALRHSWILKNSQK